jgi:hypothetical protein
MFFFWPCSGGDERRKQIKNKLISAGLYRGVETGLIIEQNAISECYAGLPANWKIVNLECELY